MKIAEFLEGKSSPGRVKRAGVDCSKSVTALRKQAKNSSGEKQKMAHWCANMKSGRKKKASESEIAEKSSSKKQAKTMTAACKNADFRKKVDIPKDVACDFHKADKGTYHEDLDELRQLAGLKKKEDTLENLSISGNEKAQMMKKYNIKPGTEDWFKLWFSKPKLTGEEFKEKDK